MTRKENVVCGLRCCKSEPCEDRENTFELAKQWLLILCCFSLVYGGTTAEGQEESGEEEGERQHTFQLLRSEGNEITG